MKTKQKELLRDLVKFATKYKASDWQAVLKLVNTTKSKVAEKEQAGSKATSRLKNEYKKLKGKKVKTAAPKRPATKKTLEMPRRTSSKKINENESIQKALIAIPPRQLRFAYLQIFQEKQVPENRHQISMDIKNHLMSLSATRRRQSMTVLLRQDDASENYKRWLQIIASPDRK